jgi:site-specific recombinase XerD
MANEIENLKRQFLEYLEIEKGSSVKTIENYERYLSKIFTQSKWTNVSDITDQGVREFRIWLNRQYAKHSGMTRIAGTTISKKTQNYYMIALRMFLKYLARIDIKSMPADKIELAKIPERSIDIISQKELLRLLEAPLLNLKGDSIKAYRDKAILELLFSTGLRVSELCSLTSDLDLNQDQFSIRGKGGKVRVVFLSDEAKKALKKYMDLRKDMEEALFVQVGREIKKEDPVSRDRQGKQENKHIKIKYTGALTRRSVERIVKEYAIKAGITKKVTPHVIRHCFATDLLGNGADIRSVQVMLGHSNIATTQIYTHVTDKQLLEVHKKFHGKNSNSV